MSMLNVWRIPLLFFISGMGVAFAIRKRNWLQLIMERIRRILVPFLFGIFTIVPLHVLIWQKYYSQDLSYTIQLGHLWFLANIFAYVLLLIPLFIYIRDDRSGNIIILLRRMFGTPWAIVLIASVFVLEAILADPDIYEMYALSWHGFILGALAFFFGFCFVQSGDVFWQMLLKWRWVCFSAALLLFGIRLVYFQLKAPGYLVAVESNAWIFAVLGFGHKYLNRSGKVLRYLSGAAYPVYIIHMIFLYLGAFLILPLNIPPGLKFILITLFTGMGCFAAYDLLIRRVKFLRPLFGLKPGRYTA